MAFKKVITTGCIISILATSGITFGNSIFPAAPSQSTSVESSQEVTNENIQNQINNAARIVDKQEKEAFKLKFEQMTPQERYDYLVPDYLEELRMIYSQMKMMEQEFFVNGMTGYELETFDYKIADYQKSLDKLGEVGQHEFYTTINLYDAAEQIKKMNHKMKFIAPLVGKYNPDDVNLSNSLKEEYYEHEKLYTEYYNESFEYTLMREFNIKIDDTVDRSLQESIIVHNNNVKTFEEALDAAIKCGESYAKGKADPDLYKAAGKAVGLKLNLRVDPTGTSYESAKEHPELTPLAYDAVSKIRAAGDATTMFTYRYKSEKKKESKKEMETAQEEASAALRKFKKACDKAMKTADKIDQNILKNVAEVKATRERTARANGFDSWFAYQLALEKQLEEDRKSKIIDQATDLAVEQKAKEEEARAKAQAEYEQMMRERVDFSKPLSQQNYDKKFYMQKAQAKLERTFNGDSGWVSLGMTLETDAFDQLFKIRANGGDVVTMQQLFDQNPFEFATILRLYKSYQ